MATEITPTERRYVLDAAAAILAADLSRSMELLYPEQVAYLCKCDCRTLEKKGLVRRYMGRSVRYRRADVEALIATSGQQPRPNAGGK
jgi:hypothetical protein